MEEKKTMSNYFEWLATTPTTWWHDSANPDEILRAKERGAMGVTTNPVLTYKTFQAHPEIWMPLVEKISDDLDFEERAEALLKLVATSAAKQFEDVFAATNGRHGLALGQLNPSKAGDAEAMYAQAKRIHSWADNIAIKLPATGAGIEVVEKLAEDGIPICATINVSVAQALAVAEAYERGKKKCKSPALCLVVQQVGRLDDYLRDVAKDEHSNIQESDICLCGLAMARRTYQIFQEKGYSSVIMPAGLRGSYHVTGMSGAKVTFSIHPRVQDMILKEDPAQETGIDKPLDEAAMKRLMGLYEFRRAYEPDGLKKDEFITYGVTQKLLSQFMESGWAMLETYNSNKVSKRWT